MSQYIHYPSAGSGVATYANFAAFPASAANGALALALDTDILYAYNTGSAMWGIIGGPGVALSIGTLDSTTASAKGAAISSNQLIMQSASVSVPGLVNNTTQSFSGNKTYTGTISASNLSGTNTGDVTLGTANGLSLSSQILSLGTSSGSTPGALTSTDWTTFNNKQSTISFAPVGSSPNGNAATISGGVITLQAADALNPGVLTTVPQTINGSKTFSSAVTIAPSSAPGVACLQLKAPLSDSSDNILEVTDFNGDNPSVIITPQGNLQLYQRGAAGGATVGFSLTAAAGGGTADIFQIQNNSESTQYVKVDYLSNLILNNSNVTLDTSGALKTSTVNAKTLDGGFYAGDATLATAAVHMYARANGAGFISFYNNSNTDTADFGVDGAGNLLFFNNQTPGGAQGIQVSPSGGIGIGTNTSFTNNILQIDPVANTVVVNGQLSTKTAGQGLQIKGGANAKIGSGTLSGGTVVISNTSVTSGSRIFLQDTTSGALTNVGTLVVSAVNAGTSFTVNSSNVLDSSTFWYFIVEEI